MDVIVRMDSVMLTLKTWVGDDCRRIDVPRSATLAEAREAIAAAYAIAPPSTLSAATTTTTTKTAAVATAALRLRYRDDDNDLVTLATDTDWAAARRMLDAHGASVLRIVLDGPPETPEAAAAAAAATAPGQEGSFNFARPARLPRARFDPTFSDDEVVEILRDLNFFIYARDHHPLLKSWVSASKTLLRPTDVKFGAGSGEGGGSTTSRVVVSKEPVVANESVVTAVRAWTLDDVAAFLRAHGFHAYETFFREHHITGDVLLDLHHAALRDIGMVSTGHRLRLLRLIGELAVHGPVTVPTTTD